MDLRAHHSLGLQVARPEEGERHASDRNPGTNVIAGVGPVPVDRPVENSAVMIFWLKYVVYPPFGRTCLAEPSWKR